MSAIATVPTGTAPRLSPIERLEALCDPGSIAVLRSRVVGARMQEGQASLAGYGRIFRETVRLTGVVPQISVVSGASAGGGAYSPALTVVILMTEDAAMFLT